MARVAGSLWTVEVRWAPRDRDESLPARVKRRWTRVVQHMMDAIPDVLGDALGEGLLIALAFIVVGLVLIFVVIPLVIVVIDLVLLLLVTIVTTVLRVFFRRPWIVQARSPEGDLWSWRIVGWSAARRRRSTVVDAIAAGRFPPPEVGTTGPSLDDLLR